MPNTDVKRRFCESLEWGKLMAIRWYDKTGMIRLNDELVARIELETQGAAGTYQGFLVTMLNRREGEVARKYFLFDDYLDRTQDGRKDGRKDYPLGGNSCYAVHASCGWEWYIATPKSTVPFCAAVEGWLEEFK